MSRTEMVLVVLGLLINEVGDWCPWLARRLAHWSARHRYAGDPERAAIRSEELEALIDDRPGNLCKLGTALGFAIAAAVTPAVRAAGVLRVIRRGIGAVVVLHCRLWTTTAAAVGLVVGYTLHSPAWVLVPVLLVICAAVVGALASVGRAGEVELLLSSGLFVLGGTAAASTLDNPPPGSRRQPGATGPAHESSGQQPGFRHQEEGILHRRPESVPVRLDHANPPRARLGA
jgi:hypothetical protein